MANGVTEYTNCSGLAVELIMVIGLKLPVPLAVNPLRPAGGVIAVQVNEVA